jgi:hypothetical protein
MQGPCVDYCYKGLQLLHFVKQIGADLRRGGIRSRTKSRRAASARPLLVNGELLLNNPGMQDILKHLKYRS